MTTPGSLLPLPIDPFVPRVIEALRAGRDVVLVAEPGAGKTTRIAPALVQSRLLAAPNEQVIMLQPRRVAARAAAARIAEEQGWRLGSEVGYQVRFERMLSRDTPLRVLTEGILVRRLVGDPELSGVGCVILDEFHERSIHSDLSLAMLREAKAALRPDLRLVVMSATLDADAVATFLGETTQVEVFHVPGRLFPVEVTYAGDQPRPTEDRVAETLASLLEQARAGGVEDAGDVLVFLPGVREIDRTMGAIDRIAARHGYAVLPLHGSLTKDEQDAAVRFDPSGPPRVICATNIAETSLTLPGVRAVIDSGLVRQAGYDAERGLETLRTERISKAGAEQRAGRAGRVAEGRCIRLWSKMTHHRLPDFDVPEIRRVDLAEAVLAVHAWGETPASFGWFEPPEAHQLESAMKLLEMFGAVEAGHLTALGRALQHLPVHPRAARLLLSATPALRPEAATAAAMLGEGAEVPGRRIADIRELLEAWEHRRLDPAVGRAVERAREALLRAVTSDAPAAAHVESIEELLLLAFPDRVCRRRSPDAATLVNGGGVRLPEPSAVRGNWFLALDLRRGTLAQKQQADVRLLAEIDPAWLSRHFPQQVVTENNAEWDEQKGRVSAVRRVRYHDLVLEQQRGGRLNPAVAARALREQIAAKPGGEEAFLSEDPYYQSLMRRTDLLDNALPGHLRPPNATLMPPSVLDVLADSCLTAALQGETTLERVRQLAIELMRATVAASPLGRLLKEHAPESIEVPSGSRITLDWSGAFSDPCGHVGPSMAVRLQELFGLAETPRVCGGTVPVTLHLLGPNFRPVQVTSDLASFWSNTYPRVRKDLRARYPKHAWPEDPLAAEPVRGARRRAPS